MIFPLFLCAVQLRRDRQDGKYMYCFKGMYCQIFDFGGFSALFPLFAYLILTFLNHISLISSKNFQVENQYSARSVSLLKNSTL